MPFPFLAPLPPWIIDIMEQREENKLMTTYKNPWVVLTSGALVVKGSADPDPVKRREQLKELILNPGGNSYKGCIISTNINNMEFMYSLGKTPVGVDFDGKTITVAGPNDATPGESGRKISAPIIESVEIDTDGANNTLKTARVNVKCFSLKQFEMFELFFMKPGMNVLVEFGDSALLKSALFPISSGKFAKDPIVTRKKYNTLRSGEKKSIEAVSDVRDVMIKKEGNYNEWCQKFSDYYRSDTDASARYIQTIENSLGTYDYIAGKVLDYSFSIGDDGTYDVNFEVSQGNQVSLAIPHNKVTAGSSEKTQPADKEFRTKSQIIEMMITDFRLGDGTLFRKMIDDSIHPEKENGKKWEDDWFNFLKINVEQKDTVASDDAYISLRFILRILMNYVISDGNVDTPFFKFNLQKYKDGTGPTAKDVYVIPVSSHKYMMSADDDIIYPTAELPKLKAPIKDKNGKPPVKKEDNVITIADKDKTDGKINGYDFHLDKDLFIPNHPLNGKITATGSDRIGNALNIFIKYEQVVKIWNSTYTRIDFLDKILSLINQNSYGLFTLIYGLQSENGEPTVIDAKITNEEDYTVQQNQSVDVYRFKPTTLKSNVKQFSFNFEMSNLVAGRQIFNSGKLLAEAKAKTNDWSKFELPDGVYKAVDNATMGNADGYYSINNVELKKLEKSFEELKARLSGSTDAAVATDPPNESATTEAEDLTQVVINKSVNFLMTKTDKTPKTLIFKDKDFLTKNINEVKLQEGSKKSTLSPIEVSLTIDGFSGFTPGQYFKIDGIPEIYNQVGVFQITNTKHSISSEGWNTTIEAGHRIM